MNKQTLRDMKREATANALAQAAFELAIECGMDGFVVDDIVQRANYSRRTFANHFSCKEEAVMTAVVTFNNIHEAEELLAAMPGNSSPLDILYNLLMMQITAEYLWKIQKLVSLSMQSPTLEPYVLSAIRHLQMVAQEVLSDHIQGEYPEGYTHLLVGAVYGAFMPLLDGTLDVLLPGQSADESSDAIPFEQYVETMFGYLRKGFY